MGRQKLIGENCRSNRSMDTIIIFLVFSVQSQRKLFLEVNRDAFAEHETS